MAALWRSSTNRVQSVAVEVCWRPAQGETSGDFHDLIDLRDGRVALVLGDAPASGAAAAELGEELRFELRRAIRCTQSGPEIMRPLDELLASRGMDKIATVVCAVLDPTLRRAEVTNAGHLPIMVATGSGTRFLEERVDPPLGVAAARRSITYELGADSALFMFTDGLVERRGASLTDGLATALEVARGMTGSAASASELARRTTERLGQPADDATAMSVRLRPPEPFVGEAGAESHPTGPSIALRVYLDPADLISVRVRNVVESLAGRLSDRMHVEVDFVDINTSTGLADADGVLAAPTVVKVHPLPQVRVVGGLRSPGELGRALQLSYSEEID